MYSHCIKRLLDLIISILVFPLFAVITVFVAVVIKVDDGGPVFYVSNRIGKDQRIFRIYKYRSMKTNAPDLRNNDGSTYNSVNDPRVTRLGKFLRETSLDEIPQVINVLKGDMSLVGPRPGMPDLVSTYKPDEMPRLSVRPGITGYVQAYFRNGLCMREKRLKDAWYASNVTFWLDLNIVLKTVGTVIRRDGLYTRSNSKTSG